MIVFSLVYLFLIVRTGDGSEGEAGCVSKIPPMHNRGASDLELPTAGFQAANILQDGAPEAYYKWIYPRLYPFTTMVKQG